MKDVSAAQSCFHQLLTQAGLWCMFTDPDAAAFCAQKVCCDPVKAGVEEQEEGSVLPQRALCLLSFRVCARLQPPTSTCLLCATSVSPGAPTDWGCGCSFAQIYACICFHSFSRVCGEGASSPFEYNTLTETGRGLSTFPPHTVLALPQNP